ncbi:MAG: hypothetical protein M0Z53_12585 [Thermaerobacter sp.]|nr:hypothetical protein [Thermaerobacter sp.]
MVDTREWKMVNEGNLARTWERRLKPRNKPRPRRQLAPWVGGTAWIAGLWVAGVAATWLAIHVVLMGYQVDALQSQLTAATRQNQNLKATVATMTSATVLRSDALRLKVQMVTPRPSLPVVRTQRPFHPPSLLQSLTGWIAGLRGAVASR